MDQYDIQLYSISEQLDRIENKIDNRLNKNWLTTQDVIKEYGFSLSTIQRAIRSGQLKVSRNTGKNMFRRVWVDKWLNG